MKSIDCILGRKIEGEDDAGNLTSSIDWAEELTFCEFQSISYKEFYQAQATGFKPEMNLKISSWDYANEEYVRYEDEDYTIIKVYLIKAIPDEILLTCMRGIRNVSS